ncbi:hypothetical protein E2542_SST22649 [Spatholobus suberectus]|nr:hypothetical protein E2542_SST22649 [Spatholobus suberectus]
MLHQNQIMCVALSTQPTWDLGRKCSDQKVTKFFSLFFSVVCVDVDGGEPHLLLLPRSADIICTSFVFNGFCFGANGSGRPVKASGSDKGRVPLWLVFFVDRAFWAQVECTERERENKLERDWEK